MRELLFWLGLSFCSIAVAQPTSFAGITPGKTTRDELKSLVAKPDKIASDDSFSSIEMKQPEGVHISGRLQGDIVYEVVVSLLFAPELKQALIEKYGSPKIRAGAIRMVTCKNNFGASFTRPDGEEELRWPVKNGVQGAITRLAAGCVNLILEQYTLRHNSTFKAIEAKEAAQLRKESEESRRKLDGAL